MTGVQTCALPIYPLRGICIDMTPTIDDQVVDVTLFKFWEGGTELKGTVENKPVGGVGFAELVADHDYEIIAPSTPTGLTVVSDSGYYSLSWQAGTQGTYPIGGYRVYRSGTNDGYWQYLASTANLSYNDISASSDSSYYYTVSSFDDQTATSGSDYATAELGVPVGLGVTSYEYRSLQCFPNPISATATVRFSLLQKQKVTLILFDMLGQTAKIIYNDMYLNAGTHSTFFNTGNFQKGVYMLKLQTEKNVLEKKILVVR